MVTAKDHKSFVGNIAPMGMTRVKPQARDRVLSDDEIRAVWRAAEAFPRSVR